MLVAEDCVPIPQWPLLLCAIQDRLKDGSVLVVKAALHAFQTLIE